LKVVAKKSTPLTANKVVGTTYLVAIRVPIALKQ